jgi:hypothetical protein
MSDEQARIYRDILHRTSARYMTVKPAGIVSDPGADPIPVLDVRVVDHHAARTLYRNRRPVCRSLDGATSVDHQGRTCSGCGARDECTSQIMLNVLLDWTPYRLLLAYSSAANFLMYLARLQRGRLDVHAVTTRIEVVARGAWGELRFRSIRQR